MTRGRHRAQRAQRRRNLTTVAVLSVVTALLASLTVAGQAAAVVGVPVTYDGFNYSSTVNNPSENKPQSKLWYTDGAWWALLLSPSDSAVHIFELRSNHTWRDTGTVVDTRPDSTGDALWTASTGKLTVASRNASSPLRVTRFSYSSASRSYSLDPGFPVILATGGGSESATIDRDSTGRLWVTYTRQSKVFVAHSDPSGLNWTAGFSPNVPDVSVKSDDISSVVAFAGHIGVMWSDQQSHAFRFAIHRDGDPDTAWRVENAMAGADLADDHINLKGLVNDAQGRLFAAIKTSQDNAGPGATLVGVLVRTPRADGTGSWELVPAGTVADDHTRPIIAIDQTNQELYFFATAPVSGGDIYYKKTSLANPSFGPGRGQKFVDSAAVVNNASASKDPVTASTGMVILATANGRKRYVHAEMELAGGGSPGDSQPPTTPGNFTAVASTGQVDLTWSESDDNVGVAGYAIYRGSTEIDTTPATSYRDTSVVAGSTYTYTVRAFDAEGNRSAPSAVRMVTVPGGPPAGDIVLGDVRTAVNAAEKTIDVPVPSAQSGDLLLATIDYRGQGAITAPAGWQLVRLDSSGTAMRKATYWRIAGSSQPESYRWSFSASPAAVGSISAYSGASATSPIRTSGGQANDRAFDVTAPSVAVAAGDVVVGLFGIARAATMTPPAGTMERSEVTSPAGVVYPQTAETADLAASTAGATGPLVARSSVAGPSVGQLVVLRAEA